MLSLIGAGWSRTGTHSLALAVEALGFGPCQHMASIASDSALADRWCGVFAGTRSWEEVHDGYCSAVDWPTAVYATELARAYPDALVVLTVRPANSWFASFARTVLSDAQPGGEANDVGWLMTRAARDALAGNAWNPAGWQAAYERHVASVTTAIDPDRLLRYSVREGWGPLCRFLDVPLPHAPFPLSNDRASFRRHLDAWRTPVVSGGSSPNSSPLKIQPIATRSV